VQSAKAEATISARLFPAKPGSVPIAVAFPEHGSGRASKITACRHCGAKPLILRKCAATVRAPSASTADSITE
jgi:hypothetical protein